jgi:hypothetical protein
VHLVLARLPDAPEGSRGISLFLVPKFLLNEDGTPGERNDVYPVSTEHKLGIHGSPTCVMAYGDNGGAVGYLVGEENRGLACMFTMMNEARLKVGIQGLGIAEGAYQQAVAYARERVQGGGPIIRHADVRRMLLTMRALTEAMRALAYSEAVTMDLAHFGAEDERPQQQARIDLMIPMIKGWMTEAGIEVASLGMQVHGGMGYIEETGAAQYWRDARIAPIYEGTNGIQAADLVGRKLGRDGGATMEAVTAELGQTAARLAAAGGDLALIGRALAAAAADHARCTKAVLDMLGTAPEAARAAAFDYMMQTGYLFGGWQLARAAEVAQRVLPTAPTIPSSSARSRRRVSMPRSCCRAARDSAARSTAPRVSSWTTRKTGCEHRVLHARPLGPAPRGAAPGAALAGLRCPRALQRARRNREVLRGQFPGQGAGAKRR